MASTTDLGKWMLTNGGEYNPETAYEQLTMVMYENSTYITLKTVQGITPTDDHINYQLMAKGFNPTALESVQAEDTSGVLGEVGGTVSAQDLINWVVDQAATKLLKISDLVSVQTNDATKGVSAALAYAMGQKLDQLNSNFNDRIYFKETGNGNTFNIKRSNGWCFFYNLGEDGANGNSDILSFRCNYDGNKVVITKLTNMSGISCDATISDNIVHFTFGGQFINAIIITG